MLNSPLCIKLNRKNGRKNNGWNKSVGLTKGGESMAPKENKNPITGYIICGVINLILSLRGWLFKKYIIHHSDHRGAHAEIGKVAGIISGNISQFYTIAFTVLFIICLTIVILKHLKINNKFIDFTGGFSCIITLLLIGSMVILIKIQ